MKRVLGISMFVTIFLFVGRGNSAPLDLIKKSSESEIREEFETVFGDLTKYDYLLICPENYQISVVIVSDHQKITRKYWRLGIPKERILVKEFDNSGYSEFVTVIDTIFRKRERIDPDPLMKVQMNLYRKARDGFTWTYVQFPPGLKENEFEILYKFMIPKEDIPNEQDLKEFLRGAK